MEGQRLALFAASAKGDDLGARRLAAETLKSRSAMLIQQDGWQVLPVTVAGEPQGALVILQESPDKIHQAVVAASTFAARLSAALELRDQEARRSSEVGAMERQLEAYALDLRETYAAERKRAEELQEALDELEITYLSTVRGLAVAVEAKDAYTAGHIARVTAYGLKMMQIISPEEAGDPQFEYGFLLHDIGKLIVPDAVLGKKGPLTGEEWKVMRLHPETGSRILSGIPFLAEAREIVLAHHEKWDGTGYPLGLKGEEIRLGARVFPIADTFDAMTSNRPYRDGTTTEAARAEIEKFAGTQFWPEAVKAFLSIPLEELEVIRNGTSEWRPLRAEAGPRV